MCCARQAGGAGGARTSLIQPAGTCTPLFLTDATVHFSAAGSIGKYPIAAAATTDPFVYARTKRINTQCTLRNIWGG